MRVGAAGGMWTVTQSTPRVTCSPSAVASRRARARTETISSGRLASQGPLWRHLGVSQGTPRLDPSFQISLLTGPWTVTSLLPVYPPPPTPPHCALLCSHARNARRERGAALSPALLSCRRAVCARTTSRTADVMCARKCVVAARTSHPHLHPLASRLLFEGMGL